MSDIFISYASEDRPWVKVLANALQAHGWSVWWDRTIPTGKSYHRVIEEALAEAQCVIVVWSHQSVSSDWVRAEAEEGLKREALVPLSIDDSKAPLVFRQIQTADLSGWQGDTSSPLFQKLLADIAGLIGPPPNKPKESKAHSIPPPPAGDKEDEHRPPKAAKATTFRWPLTAVVVGIIILATLWLVIAPRDATSPMPSPEILTYDAEPRELRPGQSATLRWDTSSAENVTLNGKSVSPSGSTEVKPNKTTAYTLIATNKEGNTVKRDIEVRVETVIPAPEILAFKATPPKIQPGQSVSLGWKTTNATEIEIRGLGKVNASGSKKVKPGNTATYVLIAKNEAGKSVQKEIEVLVAVSIPKIVSFKATPRAIQSGQSSSLDWRTTDAEKVTLNGTPVSPSGSKRVNPKKTTIYEVVAVNREGESERRTITVEVDVPGSSPEIVYFEAPASTIDAGQSTTLSWRTDNADKVLLNKKPVKPRDRLTVSPSKTTSYELVAINEFGTTLKKFTINVPKVRLPKITGFGAEPDKITMGEASVLSWKTENGYEVFLNQKPAKAFGKLTISPKKTTTYTLVARNRAGLTDTKTLTVYVTAMVAAPNIRGTSSNPYRIAILPLTGRFGTGAEEKKMAGILQTSIKEDSSLALASFTKTQLGDADKLWVGKFPKRPDLQNVYATGRKLGVDGIVMCWGGYRDVPTIVEDKIPVRVAVYIVDIQHEKLYERKGVIGKAKKITKQVFSDFTKSTAQ